MNRSRKGDLIFFAVTLLVMYLLFTFFGCVSAQTEVKPQSYYIECQNMDGSVLYEGFIRDDFRYHFVGDRFNVLVFTPVNGDSIAVQPSQCEISKVLW